MAKRKKVISTFPKLKFGIGGSKRKKGKKAKKSESYTIVGYDARGNPIKKILKGLF